jgi:hypothetical protein
MNLCEYETTVKPLVFVLGISCITSLFSPPQAVAEDQRHVVPGAFIILPNQGVSTEKPEEGGLQLRLLRPGEESQPRPRQLSKSEESPLRLRRLAPGETVYIPPERENDTAAEAGDGTDNSPKPQQEPPQESRCQPLVVGEEVSRSEPVPVGGYASWQTACLIADNEGVVTWELVAEPATAKARAEAKCRYDYGGTPLFTVSNCAHRGGVASGFAYPEVYSLGEAIENYHVWGGCSGSGDQDSATWLAILLCEEKSGCPCVDGRISR